MGCIHGMFHLDLISYSFPKRILLSWDLLMKKKNLWVGKRLLEESLKGCAQLPVLCKCESVYVLCTLASLVLCLHSLHIQTLSADSKSRKVMSNFSRLLCVGRGYCCMRRGEVLVPVVTMYIAILQNGQIEQISQWLGWYSGKSWNEAKLPEVIISGRSIGLWLFMPSDPIVINVVSGKKRRN